MIDAYKIGVSISIISNAEAALGSMMKKMLGLQGESDKLSSKMSAMKTIAVGAFAVFAGTEALRGLAALTKAASQYNDEVNKTVALGGAYSKNIKLTTSAAFNGQQDVPTLDPASSVALQRDIAKQLNNDPAAAAALTPIAAKIAYVTAQATHEDPDVIATNLIKIVDLRAKIFKKDASGKEVVDSASATTELQDAAKALMLVSPYVTSSGFLAMFRQAQIPFKMMDADEAYGAAGELAASGGGARVGTALQAIFNQLIGGKMTKATALEMQKVGMLHKGEWSWSHGRLTTDKATTAKFQQDLKRPFEYIEGPLSDMLEKDGFKGTAKIAEVMRIFGVQTAQRLVAEIIAAHPQIDRTREQWGLIPDPDKTYDAQKGKSLQQNLDALEAAKKAFNDAWGSAGIPLEIQLIHGLTDALLRMSKWANDNPGTAKTLMEWAAGTAAVAVALGSLAVVVGTLSLLAGGITALVAPLTALGAAGAFLLSTGSHHATDKNAAPDPGSFNLKPAGVTDITPIAARGVAPASSGTGRSQRGGSGAAPGSSPQDPLYTHVTNAHDVGRATAGGIGKALAAPLTGGTGTDNRRAPGQPGQGG